MVVSQDAVPMAVPSGDTLSEETLFSWPIIIIIMYYFFIIIIFFIIITIEDGDSLALERVPQVDCVVVVTCEWKWLWYVIAFW